MLRNLHSGPASARFFCQETHFRPERLSLYTAQLHLQALVAAGLLHRRKSRYYITDEGRALLQNPAPAQPPPPLRNATTDGHYRPPAWAPVRPGAADFLACRSLSSEWKESKC